MTIRVLVLGGGNIGRIIASELANYYRVDILDSAMLEINDQRIQFRHRKIHSDMSIIDAMDDYHFVVNALPADMSSLVLSALYQSPKDIIDVSYMPELPDKGMDSHYKSVGNTMLCDAGLAPGLSNLIVGRVLYLDGKIDKGTIYVGGLPSDRNVPYKYSVTWNVKDLEAEYLRRAGIVRDGRIEYVDPLTMYEDIKIATMDGLEAFVTDGLRSLLMNYLIKNLEEKTVRWKGHLKEIKPLLDNGSFVDKITHCCPYGNDLVVMKCILNDRVFEVLINQVGNVTAMQRGTALACAQFARLVIQERVKPGIKFPEDIGKDPALWSFMVNNMARFGINIVEKK